MPQHNTSSAWSKLTTNGAAEASRRCRSRRPLTPKGRGPCENGERTETQSSRRRPSVLRPSESTHKGIGHPGRHPRVRVRRRRHRRRRPCRRLISGGAKSAREALNRSLVHRLAVAVVVSALVWCHGTSTPPGLRRWMRRWRATTPSTWIYRKPCQGSCFRALISGR